MTQQQVSKAMVSKDEQEMPTTFIGEIPNKIIDEIITQLREDPELYNMFQDLEFQTEFEALGDDLDIPQGDRVRERTLVVRNIM